MFSKNSIKTADGLECGFLSCKRRNGDKSMCPGMLTCIGNESTPMKTPELARERASKVVNMNLAHGFRLSCSVCGDKPPSKMNPSKLRSWQEWCTVCREVWCNQSFHSKHGGLAKKGGEKKFGGRVKDHKKRLWAIYLAMWLLSKTNNIMHLTNWLNSSSGLASVLSPRVSPEEKARVRKFVEREIVTIQRYLDESSLTDVSSSSSQTWPPVKRARKTEKPMSVEQCVLRRIPNEMNHERNWLLNMVRKFKYHTNAPVSLRDALNLMREDPSIPVAGSSEDGDVECSKGECGDVGVVSNFQRLSFKSPYTQYPASTFGNPMIVPAKSVVRSSASRHSSSVGVPLAVPSPYPAMNMKKTHIPMHVTAVPSNQTWPPTRKRERSPSFQNIPRQNSAEAAEQAVKALMMMGRGSSDASFSSSTSSSQTWSPGNQV